ncbi:ParB/RepB/Spo0J family partition protein [Ammonifex degensii]|uniref:ParB/RepB/Spo0J family partition protein n=1 Tax=Ammonifex degensii TaxID=42838 RepID=UPI000307DC61|nr:ParB N-terminal domain-containing protein [Ammonifex degensii]
MEVVFVVTMVPVDLLKPHSKNTEFFPDPLPDTIRREMLEDIRENGITTPLILARDYTILAGHQRWEIARELGLSHVPAIIKDIDPDSPEAVTLLIKDNLLRRQLNDMQVARLIRVLKEQYGVKCGRPDKGRIGTEKQEIISQFSRLVGVTERRVNQLDKLNDLIPELQSLVASGKLGSTAAYFLAFLPPEEQRQLLGVLGETGMGDLSVKQAQELRKELEAERRKKEDLLRLVASLEEEKNRVLREAQQKEKKAKETELRLRELEKQLASLRERLRQAQDNAVTQVVEKVVYKTDPELEKKLKEQEKALKAREEELKALKEKLERAKLKRAELEKQVEDLGNALAARSEAKLPISDLNRFRIAVREAARTISERVADVKVCFAPSVQNHREALDLLEKLVAHLEGELGELRELLGRARRTGKVIDLGTHKAH